MPEYTFRSSNGTLFLVRCPICHLENYAMCVAEGICAWCGYDANNSAEEHDNENKL